MKIKLQTEYKFTMNNVGFGDLPKETLEALFKDGRFASPFIESHLPLWFPELTHIKGNKPYDHIGLDNQKYDAKNFTKNGLMFMPSSQIGVGRTYDAAKTLQKINEHKMIYIMCDITDFPSVGIRFERGTSLFKSHPKGKIPSKHKKDYFKK